MKHNVEPHDVSYEAQAQGIPLPVSIDGPLMEDLTPSPYLESLGITREQRIANLLRTIHAVVTPLDESGASDDTKIPIPFMVLRGPLVREDCLTVTIHITKDADSNTSIIISQVIESNE
jgi:hypothetical protein